MIKNKKKNLEDFYNEGTPIAWLTSLSQLDTNFVWRGTQEEFDQATEKSRLLVDETKKAVSEGNAQYLAMQRLVEMEAQELSDQDGITIEEARDRLTNRSVEANMVNEGQTKEQAFS